MTLIQTSLNTIHQQINAAIAQVGRKPNSVKLLAVSKGQPLTAIYAAIEAGQIYFGENYLQEALKKIAAIPDKNIEWHFIGHIQSNKTKLIAENFSWVQSVDRIKIAERLNEQRPSFLPALNVCIEVNVSNEKSKSGVMLSELFELASALKQFNSLKLRGLMTIPAAEKNFAQQRIPYQKLSVAFAELNAKGFNLDTLSMGMTNDFAAAIAEGSTLVRIGAGIFGTRKK